MTLEENKMYYYIEVDCFVVYQGTFVGSYFTEWGDDIKVVYHYLKKLGDSDPFLLIADKDLYSIDFEHVTEEQENKLKLLYLVGS